MLNLYIFWYGWYDIINNKKEHMNTYIIEARSLDQGYPVSKTITADSEKQAKKIFEDDFGDGLTLVNIFKV